MDNSVDFQSYKSEIILKKEKCDEEFRTHLITFLAVNCGIFILNMMTSSGYPWFLFVFGGWCIGIISHWSNKYTANKNYKEVMDITDLESEELDDLTGAQKRRTDFYIHVISNISVALYLLLINIITSTAFMWSLIPAAAMFIGIASHWGQYSSKSKRSNRQSAYNKPNPNKNISSAEIIKEKIIEIILEIKGKFSTFAEDILPKIDDYVETISLLSKKKSDLKKILSESSLKNLEQEKEELIKKREAASSSALILEYDKHIDDIINHISTIRGLEEQKELLGLKIDNAINNLKQLHLELVGMKSKTTYEDTSVLDDFEKKSSDLTLYYNDLLESYDELYKM